ncbi:MAG: putative Histidine kinase [Promethearchaeota archaeon]|nr:MAG: putative Histidine kinase [Candidatus Lokiarchaeota archaeon]
MSDSRNSGIKQIGKVNWGLHVCYFYYTIEDYFDILIPYFKQGLEDNELCIWVDTKHITKDDIFKTLTSEFPNYKKYEKSGRLLILDYRAIYYEDEDLNLFGAAKYYLDQIKYALNSDCEGLRLSGDAKWLRKKNWDAFIEYENTVGKRIRKKKVITLCTYPINKFYKRDILEIANTHQFALFKKKDGYKVIKSSQREQIEAEREQIQKNLHKVQYLENLGILSRSIAHDFNNLLGLIKGYNDMALMNINKNGDVRDYLREISKSIKSAAKLINQLNEFNPENPLELTIKETNINQVINELLEMFSYFISENIKIETNLEEKLFSIKGDPEKISQIIMNLILNARDAIEDGGKIFIETKNIKNGQLTEGIKKKIKHKYEKDPQKGVLIKVKDNGVGMDKKILKKIFQPFFTTKSPGKGTGLGLTIVKRLVNQHNGMIDVKSEVNKGTEFEIFIPA